MEDVIKRLIYRLFPALAAGYHLPRFAQVVDDSGTQNGGEICDKFTPHYSVHLQVLDQHGKPDPKFDILHDITLPTFLAGNQRGLYGKPAAGTWVEIAFAYGSPQRPFIRSILPHERILTPLEEGEQRWQQNPQSYTKVDQQGNWTRKTNVDINDEAENYEQQVGNIANRLAKQAQRLKVKDGGTVWVGNESDNVLKILEDTIQLLSEVTSTIANHTHPDVRKTNQSGAFSSQATQAKALKNKLKPIVE